MSEPSWSEDRYRVDWRAGGGGKAQWRDGAHEGPAVLLLTESQQRLEMEVVEEMHAIAWIAARAPETPPQSNPAKLTRLEEPVRLTR